MTASTLPRATEKRAMKDTSTQRQNSPYWQAKDRPARLAVRAGGGTRWLGFIGEKSPHRRAVTNAMRALRDIENAAPDQRSDAADRLVREVESFNSAQSSRPEPDVSAVLGSIVRIAKQRVPIYHPVADEYAKIPADPTARERAPNRGGAWGLSGPEGMVERLAD